LKLGLSSLLLKLDKQFVLKKLRYGDDDLKKNFDFCVALPNGQQKKIILQPLMLQPNMIKPAYIAPIYNLSLMLPLVC
jgi:hypothetical protein